MSAEIHEGAAITSRASSPHERATCGITANEHPRMSLRSSGLRLRSMVKRTCQISQSVIELPASAFSPLRTWATGQGRLWPVG